MEKAAVEVGRAKARLIMAKVKLENAALRLRKESKALVLQHVSDNIDDRQHEQTFRVGPVSEAAIQAGHQDTGWCSTYDKFQAI